MIYVCLQKPPVGGLVNFEKSERPIGLLRAARGVAAWGQTEAESRP